MKSGWNWFSLWYSKLPAQSDVLTGNSSLIASAWSVDQQHIRASPCSRSPQYWSLPRPFFIYLCRDTLLSWTWAVLLMAAQEEVFLWLPSFCSRGQTGADAQGAVQLVLLPLQASCSCPGLIPQFKTVLGGLRSVWPWISTLNGVEMDSQPLNGVSHLCACSFCPCSLGKDSG